jgi:hypothetical protein
MRVGEEMEGSRQGATYGATVAVTVAARTRTGDATALPRTGRVEFTLPLPHRLPLPLARLIPPGS